MLVIIKWRSCVEDQAVSGSVVSVPLSVGESTVAHTTPVSDRRTLEEDVGVLLK